VACLTFCLMDEQVVCDPVGAIIPTCDGCCGWFGDDIGFCSTAC
jgi:hypothetical protein